jgi:hypothetical protein
MSYSSAIKAASRYPAANDAQFRAGCALYQRALAAVRDNFTEYQRNIAATSIPEGMGFHNPSRSEILEARKSQEAAFMVVIEAEPDPIVRATTLACSQDY